MKRSAKSATPTESCQVYFGTYTAKTESQGIYMCRLDMTTGVLTAPELATAAVNPSFLGVHPNRRFLYAVSEMAGGTGGKTGAVSAFGIDAATGELTQLNQASSGGAGPCHLVVDRAGKNALVANYSSGSVAVLPIDMDGRLREPSCAVQHRGSSVNRSRQEGPHAHSINLDAANRFAFAADLGTDKVYVYAFDPVQGTLTPHTPPAAAVKPGAGPRHFAFHPSGTSAYVINELDSTVTVFGYDAARGVLRDAQAISTLPEDFKETNYPAEVQVHPSGRFVYGSNRGHDSIAVFAVDAATGTLTPSQHSPSGGKWPRHFGIDPTSRWLIAANHNSNNVVVFGIDAQTGELSPTGQVIDVPMAVCVTFLAV
ncbi:MAG: 6-phosphogluconolactonase [Lentisphaerae bacterium RIFOXYB12_FULL_65_16]|nr:MAG: 6-phosphogluconolactonase [Lentisphaerae bacterium RIFOXYA12_64_32]OGV92803.1 MAG: 6-phosphogluconolactonase [Lentisphaerae bacterium RIFOXYB12_FULL_65_16]